jgi:hypothetical protein
MNGNGKLLWWLLGIVGTLLTGGASAWLGSVHSLTRIHGEKIAVLESQIEAQRHQLDRIDQKLDRLLEREKGPR